jgi:multidrug efflux pump
MIARFFISRPIAAMVLSVLTLLVGVLSLTTLPIAQYPDVVPPQVVITAFYPGANAQTVAETVAAPIELEINGVENMLYMESQCTSDGSMRLTVTFKHGTDPDQAQVLVQNRVAIATSKLPEDVRRIGVVAKKQSSAILLVVSLFSESGPDGKPLKDQLEISNFATLRVKDELARINGVGDVFMFGIREYSVRVWLDPIKMADRELLASEVVGAIRQQNTQVAAGIIGQPPAPAGQQFQFTINTRGRFPDIKSFENMVVKIGSNESAIRLKDVGRVELGARNYDTSATLDGRPSVGMPIFQLPGSSAFQTAEDVQAKMKELKKVFPPGLDYAIVFNPTTFVKASVDEVVKTLIEAFVLVFVVVLVFLQSWRAAVIPMIAVPVSLIGTFTIMAGLGFSINNLTLFGMVLAIGIVVDDAIVVVEAVEAQIAKGLSPLEATKKAMDEVSGAIIGVSLVLAAVFIPAAFLPGLTGQFFKQFAVTIAISTVLSAINSLTLSPALCPLLLRPSHGEHAKRDPIDSLLHAALGWWFFKAFNWSFDRGAKGYAWGVGKMARFAIVILIVYGGLLVLTGTIFSKIPGGFIPQQDQGYLVVNITLPEGTALEKTDAVVKRVVDLCLGEVGADGKRSGGVKGVSHATAVSGYSIFTQANLSNSGGIYLSLDDFGDRKGRHADAILLELNARLAQVQEGTVAAFGAPPILGLGNAGGFKLQVQDKGGVGMGVLEGMTWNLAGAASKEPGIPFAFSSFSSSAPQINLEIDRERAQQMGVSVQAINDTLQVYLGSSYANDVTLFNRNWQVNVQAEPEFRKSPRDIGALKVRGPKGDMIPLEGLIKRSNASGPSKVNRYQMYPSADLNGFVIPFLLSSGEALRKMETLAERELPDGMGFEWTDMAYQQKAASNQRLAIPGLGEFRGDTTLLVFGLSTVVAYLVLAFLYESLLLPLSVILVVPMCLLCAAVGVMLVKGDLNIFTQTGLVVLVGLACKNAILIVEFAKQRREEGATRVEAAKEAARQRLRPILMTSLAFILGVLPLVIAEGAGAEMRKAIGITVFSGMLGVTVFGLILTPVFYVVMDWLRGEPKKPDAHAATPHA